MLLNLNSFQYRKRYEVTCDSDKSCLRISGFSFQYRKRYEVTCDPAGPSQRASPPCRFNTASGMRSHATTTFGLPDAADIRFQYRKRYEVTCDGFQPR